MRLSLISYAARKPEQRLNRAMNKCRKSTTCWPINPAHCLVRCRVFTSLQTLVSNAEDPAARQALIGKAEGLVNQFKTTDQYLRDQDKQVNIAIGSSVAQIQLREADS